MTQIYTCENMQGELGKMNQLYIVMYHYVRELKNSRYPQIKGIEYDLFKRQIVFFENNFQFVTMEEVLEDLCGGKKLPEKAMLLTFDDGYIDHFTYVFPILKAHHIQGSFFIPGKTFVENTLLDVNKVHFILATSNIDELLEKLYAQLNYYRGAEYEYPSNKELFETYGVENRFDDKKTVFIKRILQTVLPEHLRNMITTNLFEQFVGIEEKRFAKELYLNYDQIQCMKQNGMYIGIHGYDHYWLGNLSRDEMEKDISKALDVLSGVVDQENWVMNYPYGSYSSDVIDFVKGRGCQIALTTQVRCADLNVDNRYELPRLDCNDFPPKSNNYLKC